jgi:hypothetical protein
MGDSMPDFWALKRILRGREQVSSYLGSNNNNIAGHRLRLAVAEVNSPLVWIFPASLIPLNRSPSLRILFVRPYRLHNSSTARSTPYSQPFNNFRAAEESSPREALLEYSRLLMAALPPAEHF